MAKIEIYTKSWCPYSTRAKDLLDRKGVSYEEIDVTDDSFKEAEMVERASRQTVPQIFINGHHLGGSDELLAADKSGRLDLLLSSQTEGEAA